ncbi:hypothetical protein GGR51DRAFT_499647 [Nemania sp. FL0031]|nr:hypothetical protein GGR51DRAFT_499647 [Nemania sp. FL0031]
MIYWLLLKADMDILTRSLGLLPFWLNALALAAMTITLLRPSPRGGLATKTYTFQPKSLLQPTVQYTVNSFVFSTARQSSASACPSI